MKWPIIPATLLLLISLQSCKETYSSLPKDPLQRMNAVMKTDNSELLAEVAIFEKDYSIMQAAVKRMADDSYIKSRIEKMSQQEICDYILDTQNNFDMSVHLMEKLTDKNEISRLLVSQTTSVSKGIRADVYIGRFSDNVDGEIIMEIFTNPLYSGLKKINVELILRHFKTDEILRVIAKKVQIPNAGAASYYLLSEQARMDAYAYFDGRWSEYQGKTEKYDDACNKLMGYIENDINKIRASADKSRTDSDLTVFYKNQIEKMKTRNQ